MIKKLKQDLYDYEVAGNHAGIEQTKKAMLECRREHNIFEVGDYIVVDSYKPEFQVFQLTQDDIGSHWISLVDFRHATDEEIKAGRRL